MRVALLRDPRGPARVDRPALRRRRGGRPARSSRPRAVRRGAARRRAPPNDAALTTSLAVDLDRSRADHDGARSRRRAGARSAPARDHVRRFRARARRRGARSGARAAPGVPPAFVGAVWGDDHPYAHPLGDPSLATATPEQLCAFYEAHYGPQAATLVVTGAFGGAEVSRIRTRFEKIPRRTLVPRVPIATIQPARHQRVVTWGLAQADRGTGLPGARVGRSGRRDGRASRSAEARDLAKWASRGAGRRSARPRAGDRHRGRPRGPSWARRTTSCARCSPRPTARPRTMPPMSRRRIRSARRSGSTTC